MRTRTTPTDKRRQRARNPPTRELDVARLDSRFETCVTERGTSRRPRKAVSEAVFFGYAAVKNNQQILKSESPSTNYSCPSFCVARLMVLDILVDRDGAQNKVKMSYGREHSGPQKGLNLTRGKILLVSTHPTLRDIRKGITPQWRKC